MAGQGPASDGRGDQSARLPETIYRIYCQRGDVENRLKELHRERLIKLDAWVQRSIRRMVLHVLTTFPWLRARRQVARAAGATS